MKKIEYTMLPWWDVLSAGRIVPVLGFLLVAWWLFASLFRKYNSSVRRGTFSVIDHTVWPLLLNTVVYTVLFWYWAAPIAAGLSYVFEAIIRNEQKRAFEEERLGRFGMNREIKNLRGEAFNDLPIEEQLAYRDQVQPYRFTWWKHMLLCVILPFLAVLLLERLGLGNYLFRVYYY